jgi:antitoxin HigA-1
MADFAPTHPGVILLTEFLEPLGISQYSASSLPITGASGSPVSALAIK